MLAICFGCAAAPTPATQRAPGASSPRKASALEATPVPAVASGEPRDRPEPAAAAAPAPAAAPTPPPAVEPVPVLVDESGKTLPQTEELPSAESPSFQRRLELLIEAIRTDEPELALPAFFPVLAYAEVKAIAKPERDWQHRLIGAFKRNIHEYHRQLGDAASGIELRGIEIPEAKVKFMKPGSEGNRVGYHRVLRSRLRLGTPDGRERAFEVTSMISWRGEWYVVHLHGFE
jgi:hypothetical protein